MHSGRMRNVRSNGRLGGVGCMQGVSAQGGYVSASGGRGVFSRVCVYVCMCVCARRCVYARGVCVCQGGVCMQRGGF